VTTSWDDGSISDLQIAFFLRQYNLKGTFYIPVNYQKRTLSEEGIARLGNDPEIGSHSLNHRELTTLIENDVMEKLVESKE